jgi:hypothetical protein
MISSRFNQVSAIAIMLAALAVAGSAGGQSKASKAPKPGRDPIIGKWKLDAKKSRFLDPQARITSMTRVYSVDGDAIKVWWDAHPATGKAVSHTFTSKCDGSVEPAYDTAQIKCEYKNRFWVNGELMDENDPAHKYYSRVVAPDGKSMKIIWFGDPERKQLKEVLLFDRDESGKKK